MTVTSAIGGYLELELGREQAHCLQGVEYSTMRGALQDVIEQLVSRRIRQWMWYPSLICPTVVDAFASTHDRIKIVSYHIGSDLLPINLNPAPNDLVYYYNPFGLLCPPPNEGILVDNAHALFQEALEGQHTFDSMRKFIGLPDGALLRSVLPSKELPAFQLDDGAVYLLRRIDQGAEGQDSPPSKPGSNDFIPGRCSEYLCLAGGCFRGLILRR